MQQISELKQVAGIEVVGPIPRELQTPAVFSAGRMAASEKADAADRAAANIWHRPRRLRSCVQSGLEP